MSLKTYLLLFLFVLFQSIVAQTTKEQLVGRVIDIANNKGLEGVAVQLLSLGSINYTDADGKFKFTHPKGFVVGEPNYSFVLQKEGYVTVGSTDNKVVYGSGSIENLSMKKDLERYLWITVLDGKTGNVLEQARVNSKGIIQDTDAFGKVRFDFSAYETSKVKIIVRKGCYKDEIIEVPTKGEVFVKMIPDCTSENTRQIPGQIDMATAAQLLDRALQARNGSKQGQVAAIESLLKSDFSFNGTDFSGVNLQGVQFKHTDLSKVKFDFCDLKNSDLQGSTLQNTTLHFAEADSFQLLDGTLSQAKAAYLKARNARFNGSDLSNSFFFGSDFSNTDFTGANLEGTIFAFCNLTNAVFEKSTLHNTQLNGCILNGASFKMANISNMGIRGTVVTEGAFPFEEAQLSDICRKPGYRGQSFGRAEYHFTLMEVSENVPTGQGRYNVAYEKRHGFANFGGTTFSDCQQTDGLKYAPFEYIKVFKSHTFLQENRRVYQVRSTVDNHFESVKSYLRPEYTIKDNKVIAEWEQQVRRELKKKRFPSTAILTRESVLALLKAHNITLSTPIDWKQYAQYHLGEKATESDQEIFRNAWQYLFPFDIRWPDLPTGWDELYLKWILDNASTAIKDLVIPMSSHRFEYLENGSLQTHFRPYQRQKARKALTTKKIDLARIALPHVFMGTGKSNLIILLVYPKPIGKLLLEGVKVPSGKNGTKINLELRQRAEVKKVEVLQTEDSDCVLLYIEPLEFYYLTGSEKWSKASYFSFPN